MKCTPKTNACKIPLGLGHALCGGDVRVWETHSQNYLYVNKVKTGLIIMSILLSHAAHTMIRYSHEIPACVLSVFGLDWGSVERVWISGA